MSELFSNEEVAEFGFSHEKKTNINLGLVHTELTTKQ
jgi:hypothetical protein